MDFIFNIDPGVVAMVMLISQFVGHIIPDDRTGILGVIRRFAKVVGVYINNQKNDYEQS